MLTGAACLKIACPASTKKVPKGLIASNAMSLYPNLSEGITVARAAGFNCVRLKPFPNKAPARTVLAYTPKDERFSAVNVRDANEDAIIVDANNVPVVRPSVLIVFAVSELVKSCPELMIGAKMDPAESRIQI
jgi:hypothetical protein